MAEGVLPGESSCLVLSSRFCRRFVTLQRRTSARPRLFIIRHSCSGSVSFYNFQCCHVTVNPEARPCFYCRPGSSDSVSFLQCIGHSGRQSCQLILFTLHVFLFLTGCWRLSSVMLHILLCHLYRNSRVTTSVSTAVREEEEK